MESISIAAAQTNWNGGQRITLKAGDTATCTALRPGQLYGIFIYNSAGADNNATVNVNWSNSSAPGKIVVPGTTANAGLASVGFVSGDDTQTVSISLEVGTGIAQVEAWLGSVSMPTDTSGLSNQPLPADGDQRPFSKYSRYYAVPPSQWMNLTIDSKITQFISCQFRESQVTVFVVKQTTHGLLPGQVVPISTSTKLPNVVNIVYTGDKGVTNPFQGDGTQYVWMDADSQQNSQGATIALQKL